jgi:hypothetical protein
MIGATMPKAPVNEDSHVTTWESNVGPSPESWQGVLDTKAQAFGVQQTSHRNLGIGVAAPSRLHPSPNFWRGGSGPPV